MTEPNVSYIGTQDPIMFHECKTSKRNHHKFEDRRAFYKVCLCFGADWKIPAKENSTKARAEATKVAKYIRRHALEIIEAAKAEK